MTRHWVEAYADHDGIQGRVICEHPTACSDTSARIRAEGCTILDFWSDTGTDLLDVARAEEYVIGRIEVDCRWSGSDEDAELFLMPQASPPRGPSTANGLAGSQPRGGEPDWKRIAVKLASMPGADFVRLSTPEADALRGALADANACQEEADYERTEDAKTSLEDR